jgi:nucleotide-binding universal stress UspA family protein
MKETTYNILVPIDFSEQSLFALNQAIGIAKAVQGKLNLLYVHHDKKGVLSKLFSDDQSALFDKAVEEKLLQLANDKSAEHGLSIDSELVHASSVATKIIKVSEEKKSAMIVMGKGRLCDEGMEMLIIGSVSSRVIRYSKVPVISVGYKVTNPQCKNIMLPLDLTKETRQKVSWGIQMARIFKARIKVVSVLWEKDNTAITEPLTAQMNQVTKFIRKAGVDVEAKIIESDKGSASLVPLLTKYIEEEAIDLALIMTQQENDISQFFLGSTATEFIRKSPVPVMSITPRETGEIIWGF